MKDFMRQDLAAIKAAQGAYDGEVNPRHTYYVVSILLLIVGLAGLGLGRQTITPPMLSDLSQQRARDIAVAVAQECDKNFVDGLAGQLPEVIQLASNRCNNVADVALEEIYAAGVEAEDRVMERAKQMAREAKP